MQIKNYKDLLEYERLLKEQSRAHSLRLQNKMERTSQQVSQFVKWASVPAALILGGKMAHQFMKDQEEPDRNNEKVTKKSLSVRDFVPVIKLLIPPLTAYLAQRNAEGREVS